jgi:hypothetical protein
MEPQRVERDAEHAAVELGGALEVPPRRRDEVDACDLHAGISCTTQRFPSGSPK